MYSSMVTSRVTSIPRRLQRQLSWASVWLVFLVSPAMASAQEPPDAASAAKPPVSSVAASNSPFDELNSRLRDTADRLAADASFLPAAPETAMGPGTGHGTGHATSNVTAEKTSLARNTFVEEPQRRARSASRVEQLRPVIDPILRGQGIPAELVAVALVESGGRAAAISPKGARGVWQLMPETARRYGLVVSGQRDDRLDLVSATQAAARYLRDLHAQFGDWELALAAYNVGEQAVQNAIQRAGSNSFAVLSRLRLLPAETRNYVPAVMGARSLFKRTTAVQGNSVAVSTSNPHNFVKGNVFFAMNALPAPRPVADGGESQQHRITTE